MMAKNPDLTVFAAVRSQWGKGLDVKEAVDMHIKGMYDSDHVCLSHCDTDGIFGILQETYELAEKLQQEGIFDAAFFFAHAVGVIVRRCEDNDEIYDDQEEKVIQWAEGLDVIMSGAIKGWRKQSGKGKKAKSDAATIVGLLVEEGKAGCDLTMWYSETLKALRAWPR